MYRRSIAVALLGLAVTVTACHHNKAPAVEPTPETSAPPPPPAPRGPNQDSIRAAEQARQAAAQAAAAAHTRMMNTIADMIHFEYNKADLMAGDIQKLEAKVALLRQFPSVRIRITGNCDERGSDDYNIALGMRRAAAAKNYMVQQGIDASRIDIASLGRENPLDPGHDETAWAKNRRDEFEIIAGEQSMMSHG
jgi:peptidoglycan-associated lipoprotein